VARLTRSIAETVLCLHTAEPGLSDAAIGYRVGLSRSAVQRIRTGEAKPAADLGQEPGQGPDRECEACHRVVPSPCVECSAREALRRGRVRHISEVLAELAMELDPSGHLGFAEMAAGHPQQHARYEEVRRQRMLSGFD
jgi:hypothetical protein